MYSFIDEYSSVERNGYMLVTLQTCIAFLKELDPSKVEKEVSKIMSEEVRTRTESLRARARAPSNMSLEALQQFISNQQETYLNSQPWYHPNISRRQAEDILKVLTFFAFQF